MKQKSQKLDVVYKSNFLKRLGIFLMLLVYFPLSSDEVLVLKDGKKILIKDNFTWQYVQSNNSQKVKFAEDAIRVNNIWLAEDDQDYDKGIALYWSYTNLTDKKIVGVEITTEVVNTFGKVVYSDTHEDEHVIEPNTEETGGHGYRFSDNQFINDQPYDRFVSLVQNGTAKFNTRILKVIFEDGSIITCKQKDKKK